MGGLVLILCEVFDWSYSWLQAENSLLEGQISHVVNTYFICLLLDRSNHLSIITAAWLRTKQTGFGRHWNMQSGPVQTPLLGDPLCFSAPSRYLSCLVRFPLMGIHTLAFCIYTLSRIACWSFGTWMQANPTTELWRIDFGFKDNIDVFSAVFCWGCTLWSSHWLRMCMHAHVSVFVVILDLQWHPIDLPTHCLCEWGQCRGAYLLLSTNWADAMVLSNSLVIVTRLMVLCGCCLKPSSELLTIICSHSVVDANPWCSILFYVC
jgi:hypothetical protein